MAKIPTYTRTATLTDDKLFLVDGSTDGTKTITTANAAKELGKRFAGADTFAEAFSNQFDSKFDSSESVRKLVNHFIKAFPKGEVSGSIAHFIDGADDIPAKIEIDISPIQTGDGDPSPDNVRPISGWTRAKVTRTGKNLLIPLEKSTTASGVTCTISNDGSITLNGTATATNGVPIEANSHINNYKPGATYYGKIFGESTDGLYYQVYADKKPVIIDLKGEFTIPNNTKECYTRIRFIEGATFDNVTVRMMCVQGTEEPAEWEPYIDDTHSINFPSEAGTVYGGKLTIYPDGTGELVVNMDRFIMGSDDITIYNARLNVFYISLARKKNGGSIYCSMYNTFDPSKQPSEMTDMSIKVSLDNKRIYFRDSRVSDSSDFKNLTSGEVFVYECTDPQTYPLTAEEVTTLLGTNNIWADTGDVRVIYSADPNLYIDGKMSAAKSIVAGVEASNVATKNYTKDSLLIVGDKLLKATVAISSGTTIDSTNTTKTTVAEQLLALA
jgi:hypothetical protein